MDLLGYENFKRALASGDRVAAASHVRRFVDSFRSFDEKATWARWYLETERFGHRIRHEIYEEIIFPVLAAGYESSDPWSIKWLARTSQNIYSTKSLWERIDGKTEQGLLRELVAACPTDDEARSDLLSTLVKSLEYMVHEWPAGILYGNDGATASECQDIKADLELARELDITKLHVEFLDDFQAKLEEYQGRLRGIDV